MKRRLLRRFCVFALLLCAYPVSVIAFTLSHVLRLEFQEGRNGQLDAYRHALASATVSYTLGGWAVDFTSFIFESSTKDSNKMDTHNNRLGANIGSSANSFRDIEPSVHEAVANGRISATDPNQITWLPASKWRDGALW